MTDARKVRALIAEIAGEPPESLDEGRALDTLAGGSFSLVELVIALQEQLGVRFGQADMHGITTVGGLVELFVARSRAVA